MRRLIVAVSFAGFVATVWAANYAVKTYGPIRVWPTTLLAPAGVYFAGLAFLLRDTVQRLGSKRIALLGILAGCALSAWIVSSTLALASVSAFALSELAGLCVFWALQRELSLAVTVSQVVAAAIDSFVFLAIAFGSLAYFDGQFVAKVSVTVVSVPAVLAARCYLRLVAA